jgi:hypothetical protein
MIQICLVTNPQSAATDFYRSVAPLRYIQQATGGAIHVNCTAPNDLEWHTLFNSDIVFFSRPNGSLLQDIILEVKDMGKKVWVDYDDLLDGLSDYNPAKVHFNKPDIIESVKFILSVADTVTVSTEYLKQAYQKYSKSEIIVLKNAFDNYLFSFPLITPQHSPIRFHWRGSATHVGDIKTVRPAFDYIINSEKWRLKVHGLPEIVLQALFGMNGYESAEWENRLFRYFRNFQEEKPDWVIFPLIDDPFNQAKSNISAIEALAAGAAVLAPSGFPEFIMPGIINYDSPEHLQEILHQIERGEIDKIQHVKEGRQWLSEFLNVQKENEKRLQVIGQLTGAKFTKKVA